MLKRLIHSLCVLTVAAGLVPAVAAHAEGPTSADLTDAGEDIRGSVSTLTGWGRLGTANGITVLNGAAFVGDGNRIVKVNLRTGLVTPLAGAAGTSACTDASSGAAARFSGGPATTPESIGEPQVIGNDGVLVYVRNAPCGLRTVNPSTGETRTLPGPISDAWSVSIVGKQAYFYVGSAGDPTKLYVQNLTTGATSTVTSSVPQHTMYTDSAGATTSEEETIDSVVADEQYVWLWGRLRMHRVDRATGAVTTMPWSLPWLTFRGNFPRHDGQVVSAGDYLYFTAYNYWDYPAINRIDKNTGEANRFAGDAGGHADGIGRRAAFNHVTGMALANGMMYVADTHVSDIGSAVRVAGTARIPAGWDDPPVATDTFVYLAFGDSYQSGEGAGNSVHSADFYRTGAYESGTNYVRPDGTTQNTYTPAFSAGGNSCHRSLANYAKLNRDKLEPNAQRIVLIDVTCSGAMIEPGSQPPMVGQAGSSGPAAGSQLDQALRQLTAAGLTPADVDLVTVGMGGNDAKFSGIVMACLLPNVARRMLAAYPNTPGEFEALANMFATCENADKYIFKSQQAIDALAGKERWAQKMMLNTFVNSRVLQLTYPDILPPKSTAPAWCGGMRKEDLDYAHGKIRQINQIIRTTVQEANAISERYELVDVERAFGHNALCPATDSEALANGIREADFTRLVRNLLNLDGTGDASARAQLDKVVADYRQSRNCYLVGLQACDPALDEVKADGTALVNYLAGKETELMGGLLPVYPGEDSLARFDRARGLFHPNANGFAVLACNVQAVYNRTGRSSCEEAVSPLPGTSAQATYIDNQIGENQAIGVSQGLGVRVQSRGWAAGSVVRLLLNSTPIDLGTAVADENGEVDTELTLPAASAGGHNLLLQGEASDGAALDERVRVVYPGQPVAGGSYGVHFEGFAASDREDGTSDEQIDVSVNGQLLNTVIPDEDGNVFLELPVPDSTDPVVITATSKVTGVTSSTTLLPTASSGGTGEPAPSKVPAGVTVAAADPQTVTVSWSAVQGAARYRVYRDGALVGEPAAVSFADRQLDGGSTHGYAVSSVDAAGAESARSAAVAVTTPALAQAPVNHARCGAADAAAGCAYTTTVAASAGHPDTAGRSLTDGRRGTVAYGPLWQGRDGSGTYSFTVDLGGPRPISEISTGWLQVRSDFVFLPANVTYSVSADGTTFHPAGAVDLPPTSEANQTRTYRAAGLDTVGRYVKVAVSAGTAWSMLDEIEVRGPAVSTVPAGITATAADAQTVNLGWTAVAGAARYRVYRDGAMIGEATGASFQDRQLDGARGYTYLVSSVDGAGAESATSTPATVTTPALPATPANHARCGAGTDAAGCAYTSTVTASAGHPDAGGRSLTDGRHGAVAYGPLWQGRDGAGTYGFTVDLGATRAIQEVNTTWLQVRSDFVFLPTTVTYSVSDDGVTFRPAGGVSLPPVSEANQTKTYRVAGLAASGRYVRVEVAAGTAWSMLDEIEVRGT